MAKRRSLLNLVNEGSKKGEGLKKEGRGGGGTLKRKKKTNRWKMKKQRFVCFVLNIKI